VRIADWLAGELASSLTQTTSSLVDRLASDAALAHHTGAAQILLCCSPNHTVGDVLECLRPDFDAFVWAEFACCAVLETEGCATLDAIGDAARYVESVLVLGAPWQRPLVAQRAQCLWALSAATLNKVRLQSTQADADALVRDVGKGRVGFAFLKDALAFIMAASSSSTTTTTTGSDGAARTILRRCWADWILATVQDAGLVHGSAEATFAWSSMGVLHRALGSMELALPMFQRAVESGRLAFGGDSAVLAACCCNLAVALSATGKEPEAEVRANEALSIFTRALGPDHLDTVTCRAFVGALLRLHGRLYEARGMLVGVVAIRRRVLGDTHVETAKALCSMAAVLQALGELDEVAVLLEESLTSLEQNPGVESEPYAASLHSLGLMHQARGELDEALPKLERALRIRVRLLGGGGAVVAQSMTNVGCALRAKGRVDDALPLFEKALVAFRAAQGLSDGNGPNGSDSMTVAGALNNLGRALHELRQFSDAMVMHGEALAMRRRLLGEQHADVAQSLFNLGETVGAHDGRLAEASSLLEEALRMRRACLGNEHLSVAEVLLSLGDVKLRAGDVQGALVCIQEAQQLREGALGSDHVDVAKSMDALARAWSAAGNGQEAMRCGHAAVHIASAVLGADHVTTQAYVEAWG